MYSVDAQQYPTYTLNVADIHLGSSIALLAPKPPLITEIQDIPIASKPLVVKVVDQTNITISTQA